MSTAERSISNVYIVGPQCTGKTTLVNALRDQYSSRRDIQNPVIITEIARSVIRDNGFKTEEIRSSPTRSLQLQNLIMQRQHTVEDTASQDNGWFISDRSGLDPIVYAREHVSPEAALEMQQSHLWETLRSRMASSLVVLCQSGTPWLYDDGVRLMPESDEAWKRLHHLFCLTLEENGIPYVTLPNCLLELDERVAFVMSRCRLNNSSTTPDETSPGTEGKGFPGVSRS